MGLLIDCRSHLFGCRALLIECKALLIECRALRTKRFLESSGCRTHPLETSAYRPRLTCWWYKPGMDVSSEFMVQIQQKTGTGVENPHPRSFLGGLIECRALMIECRALSSEYRALLIECRALMIECSSHSIECCPF